MDQFRISATGCSVNYLPEYLGSEAGIYAKHGLSVSATVPQPWPKVLEDINTGQAHAALGGIWVPSMYRSRVKDYVAFAQVSERCPLSIVGRASQPAFTLAGLIDKTVLVTGGNGSSPFLYLSGLLDAGGIDKKQIRFIHDLETPMLSELFAGGMGDYFVVDPITAGRMVQSDDAVFSACLSQAGGAVPWSVYYAVPEVLEKDSDLFRRFFSATNEAMEYTRNVPVGELTKTLKKFWPNASPAVIADIFARFQKSGMWDTGASIPQESFDTWQGVMASHGFVDRPLRLTDIVRTLG